MLKEEFDIIYSLGQDCACAKYLSSMGLRVTSGPFDWLTNAPLSTRIEYIINDFAEFLDKDDLKVLTYSKDKTINFSTDDYINTKNYFAYYHDFRAGRPFETEFKKVKAKYDRRIKRFYKNISSKKRVLLIYHAHNLDISDKDYIDLFEKLLNKFKKRITLVIIKNNFMLQEDEVKEFRLCDGLIKYELQTEAKDADGNYTNLGNIQNCNKIYSKFAVKKTFYNKLVDIKIKYSNKLKALKREIGCV